MPLPGLTPERLRRVEEVYHAARECNPADRENFVAAECGSDKALAQEIRSLLSIDGELPDLAVQAGFPLHAAKLTPGTFFGPYRIETPLGSGGMGDVYRATDTRLHRTVAIKVLPPQHAWNVELRQRFQREAEMLSSLNHPHVCILYDVGRQESIDYLVMEYVHGGTLSERIPIGGMLVGEALSIAQSIATALAAAHSAGIVHRDLKPANVMLRADGVVKVMDFGLAKAILPFPRENQKTRTLEQTRAGAVMGTSSYMSPEQAEGKGVDARSDVFAFGALLYEMLTGKQAFRGESPISTISAVLKDTPPAIHTIRRGVKPAFEAVVFKCLSKNREYRYASGVELEAALARLVSRSLPTSKRRRSLAAGLAALIVLAGGVVWWGAKQRRANWVHNQAIPEIYRLHDAERHLASYQLAMQARQILPHDPSVEQAFNSCCVTLPFQSEPPGARIFYRPYLKPSVPEQLLVQSPPSTLVPIDILRVHLIKQGFEDAEGTVGPGADPIFPLDVKGTRPAGMVSVPAGSQELEGKTMNLPAFWLDKYEVSNRSFKSFVDQGGYLKQEYWKFPFRKGGREISWEEGTRFMLDGTGKRGPATWELGSYPQGKGEYPVDGVSWYEAAAYAEFVGKSIPTVAHWKRAAGFGQFSEILQLSNFEGKGAAPAGKFEGIGPFGTYDMAGNVKEWCFNANREKRAILGGSWDEASYRFRDFDARDPMERLPGYGFRCAKFRAEPTQATMSPIEQPDRDPMKETPAGENTFKTWKASYAYDPTPLEAKVEVADDSSANYREEKVSFRAAYGDERMQARLFLPKNALPPYETVVFYPDASANFQRSSNGLGTQRHVEFLMRSGRAMFYPVYQGTHERIQPLAPGPNSFRRRVIQRLQDLQRSIDYLETRKEIDTKRLAFYGISMGCHEGVMTMPMEPRFRTAILAYCGIPPVRQPEGLDAVDLAPRIKIPVLLLEARDEFYFPYRTSTLPLFQLLGTLPKDKKMVLRAGGHIVSYPAETFREMLDWLDRYLGPVTLH